MPNKACLIQGVLIGWTVFIGVVLAVLFMTPPLWFSEVETGYTYAGAFIGALIGLVLSGILSDWTAKLMIKWNHGKYEPEFRIVLVFPQLIFSSIGMYGLAFVSADTRRYGWLPSVVFFMFVLIGMVMGAVASALYVVDAHRKSSLPSPCYIQLLTSNKAKSPSKYSPASSCSRTSSVSSSPTSHTTG